MTNISLRWCPSTALQEWAEHHWYYLPEDVSEKNFKDWCTTMHEILSELQSRNIVTTLEFFDNTSKKSETDENNEKSR